MSSRDHSAKFGASVREMRKAQGLSAQKLSDKTGGRVSRSAIAKFECGHQAVSLDDAAALADALGASIDELLHGSAAARHSLDASIDVAIRRLEELRKL